MTDRFLQSIRSIMTTAKCWELRSCLLEKKGKTTYYLEPKNLNSLIIDIVKNSVYLGFFEHPEFESGLY